MKLKLNGEYAGRHLFVTLLMVGLCGWFGYDGFVRYPATPAAVLYKSIEGSDAPDGFDLEAFKAQKTKTQYGFTFLTLFVALVVGSRLAKSARSSSSLMTRAMSIAVVAMPILTSRKSTVPSGRRRASSRSTALNSTPGITSASRSLWKSLMH